MEWIFDIKIKPTIFLCVCVFFRLLILERVSQILFQENVAVPLILDLRFRPTRES